MDNNQPLMPNPNAPVTPQVTANPAPAATVPPVAPQPAKKNTMMILIGVFVVVAILIGVGFYLFMGASKNNPDLTAPDNQTSQTLNTISTDANQIDLGDPDTDFKDVDSEVSQL